jgi:hypothetical protein
MNLSRKGAGLLALSTAAATAVALVPQTGEATLSPPQASSSVVAARAATSFGLGGFAYGSLVSGGSLPANSGRTSLAVLGCTRQTGVSDTNTLASIDLGTGLGTVSGMRSVTKTYRASNGSVNVRSVNSIAQVGSDTSALQINGIHTMARTWHDASGFHRTSRTTIGDVFSLGVLQSRVGNVITIPGVATLTLNSRKGSATTHGASMEVNAVTVDVTATNTKAVLGHAGANIRDGLVTGLLGGVGIAAKGSALKGVVKTGQVARQPLRCQGTNGVWHTNKTIGVDAPNVIHLGVATGSARGDQIDRTHGYAQTRGHVARAAIGSSHNLVIKGVVGAANVTKSGANLVKTTRGTHILSITFKGRTLRIPTAGHTTSVGGLAVLSVPKVSKTKYGISVVALRVTLTGTLATLDLGVAKASIRP